MLFSYGTFEIYEYVKANRIAVQMYQRNNILIDTLQLNILCFPILKE